MLIKEISNINQDCNYWDDERIKKAFNFGNGTKKHMEDYMERNKQYAKFEIIKKN